MYFYNERMNNNVNIKQTEILKQEINSFKNDKELKEYAEQYQLLDNVFYKKKLNELLRNKRKCLRCGELFFNKNIFKKHEELCSPKGLILHHCFKCGKKFKQKRFWKMHTDSCDPEDKCGIIYTCNECNDKFGDAKSLTVHVKQEHNKDLPLENVQQAYVKKTCDVSQSGKPNSSQKAKPKGIEMIFGIIYFLKVIYFTLYYFYLKNKISKFYIYF